MPHMTTSKSMLRVEDVSLKHPRRQSEVAKEIAKERGITPASVPVPVSMTPESIKTYYEDKMDATADNNERLIFKQTLQWIDELFILRKKVIALEAKLPKGVEDIADERDAVE